jgi:hypothetical protein
MPVAAARAASAGFRVLEPFARSIGPTTWHVAAMNGTNMGNPAALKAAAAVCVRAMHWLLDPANRAGAAALLRKRMAALDEAQSLVAIDFLVEGRDALSRSCEFDTVATMSAVERGERRLGMATDRPAGAPPRMRARGSGEPIAWGVPANARRELEMRAAGSGMPDDPLLGVLAADGSVSRAERALERALRSRRKTDDGRWQLEAMYRNFATNMGWIGDRATIPARLAAWRAAYPDSVHVRIAEAWYWTSEAWRERGSAPASQVPKAAWDRFHANLARARAVLDDAGPARVDNPAWHWAGLHVAFAQGVRIEHRTAMFGEAVRREPTFVAHYTEFARGLTPRWGGRLEDYRAFADAAVARTRATEGKSMYARLYPELTTIEFDRDPFKDLGIPWSDLRAGFEDLVARYPSMKELGLFASYACRAGDGKTYRALQPKLARQDFPVAGGHTFEACNETFLQRS